MYNPNVTPYTPGNVDETTRMLIGLKQKGQLQQYVQQHSQDPNLVALALYVNNLDNAARGAQAQQQMQPQPTVVEERLAQMAPQQLPENVGIGALPVQGMDSFADGGIVGYADGGMGYNPASGPAGRLAYDNEPVLRMAEGGVVALAGGGDLLKYGNYGFANTAQRPQYTEEELREFNRLRSLGLWDSLKEKFGPLLESFSQPFGAKPVRQETFQSGLDIGGPGSSPASWAPQPTAMTPNVLPDMPAAPVRAAPTPSATQAAAAARPVQPGADPTLDAYKKALEQYAPAKGQSREEYLAEREKYQGKDPAEAQLERLTKMDDLAQMEREDARNFALMRAGFGMMASKSPFAMVGIGEGAQSGLTDYQSAIKDLKAAERERTKLRMDAERAQYAAKGDRWEDFDKIQEKRTEGQDAFNRTLAQGIGTLMGHEMQNKTARDVANIHADVQREYTQAIREGQLENRNMALVERIRQNIAAGLPVTMIDPAERAAEIERQLKIQLKRYPALAQYVGTPGSAGAGSGQLRYNPQTGKIE